ncbi:MAG: twin transmembrane helix small protein [Hahellaceae bacterium]|nr:twin transmembrane helix small protein [Hahellaceae bacterium]
MLKFLILFLLFAIVLSLFMGLFFLVKDEGQRNRVVNSLALRVTLSALLLGLVYYTLHNKQETYEAMSPMTVQPPPSP